MCLPPYNESCPGFPVSKGWQPPPPPTGLQKISSGCEAPQILACQLANLDLRIREGLNKYTKFQSLAAGGGGGQGQC
jgi:hypothetical protein